MKKLRFVFIMCFICLQNNFVYAGEVVPSKVTHTIFLIHGIGGSSKHFGKMDDALTKVLNEKNHSAKYIVKSIEYDTGNDEKNTFDFAKDINLEIMKVTASGTFKKDDKISLIMHSQGGLVGSIWLFQSISGNKEFVSPQVIEHLDAFITLGTPFWGAKSAELGRNIDGFFNSMGLDLGVPFGTKELQDMSIGSDTVYDFRMALVNPKFKKQMAFLKENVRLLNIAGTAKVLDPIGIFASGDGKYEDDGAVLLPSARFNFLFNRSIKDDYQALDRVGLVNTEKIDLAPFIAVNGLHRSPVPKIKEFSDIVYVPKNCIDDENCDHPTFQYIWKHLLSKEIKVNNEKQESFNSFLIDLNVIVSNKELFKCEDIKIEFSKLDGSSLEESNIEISSFFELFSEGKNRSSKYPNQCRFYFTGNIKDSLENDFPAVLMKISGEGLKTRLVEVLLKSSYSSFVEINLVEQL